jgi:hypothetical protein
MNEELLREIIDQIKDLNHEMREGFAIIEDVLKSIDKSLDNIKK